MFMKTAYQLLGVNTDASDVEIKRAYIQKVKLYPPDRDPSQFQLIHQAYSSIKDTRSRMEYDLFSIPVADFDGLINHALKANGECHIKPQDIVNLLAASIDDSSFLTTIEKDESNDSR